MNYAEDCQDLLIETVVNLLKHENPYTGKTYAEDPALAYIEMQNEDDIFFFTTAGVYDRYPTYKKNLMERYARWLGEKYKDQAGLRAAWARALRADETLAAQNVALQPNPWFMSADSLPNQQGGNKQRLLDNAAFFHAVQNAFYGKFVKAIRATGYQGPLVGSAWQAPSGLPNYYNLKSDAMVGYIDRHNYFGGGLNDTMLGKPGSGDLSSGLQQVADRPFGISEWIHVYPSLYSAEGPAIFAAYGMGLQGWDASYEFQSNQTAGSYGDIVGNLPWGVWNADVPTQVGQFPALARMIMRGDVKEGEVIGVRNVSPRNLAEGKFDFSDSVVQQGDVKSFARQHPGGSPGGRSPGSELHRQGRAVAVPRHGEIRAGQADHLHDPAVDVGLLGQGVFRRELPGDEGRGGFRPGQEDSLGRLRLHRAQPLRFDLPHQPGKGQGPCADQERPAHRRGAEQQQRLQDFDRRQPHAR